MNNYNFNIKCVIWIIFVAASCDGYKKDSDKVISELSDEIVDNKSKNIAENDSGKLQFDYYQSVFQEGKYQEVISDFEALRNEYNESPQFWNLLGCSYMAVRRLDDAKICFQRQIALGAAKNGNFNLGELLFLQGNFKESKAIFDEISLNGDYNANLRGIAFFKSYIMNISEEAPLEFKTLKVPEHINEMSIIYCFIAFNIISYGDLTEDLSALRINLRKVQDSLPYEDSIDELLRMKEK